MKKFIALLGAVVLSVSLFVGCGTNKENKEEKVLGIIGAMEEEVEILKGKMDVKDTVEVAGMTFYSGKLHDKNVVLVRSGVGKVNMASCTQILADKFNVTALLNSGVAGTMDPELNQGDIVISTDAVQHDFDTTVFGDPLGEISRLGITFFQADKELVEVAKKAAENIDGLVIKEGRIASGDQFIAGGAVAERIKEHVDLELENIEKLIEIPPKPEMGDFAFPCFQLAKVMRKAPNMIAAELAEKINKEGFERVECLGPYLNFFVDKVAFSKNIISKVLEEGDKYGSSKIGEGKNVVVEYSSPNIAKPFHVGHLLSLIHI